MARKKQLVENQEVAEDSSAAQQTLHPKSGSNGADNDREDNVDPSHFQKLAAVMGAVASDRDLTTKFYSDMMAIHHKIGSGGYATKDSGGNQDSLDMHGSDASGSDHKGQSYEDGKTVKPGNTPDHSPSHIAATPKSVSEDLKKAVKEDMKGLLEGTEGLTEEFKEKASVLFEAALHARIATEVARLEEENEQVQEEVVMKLCEEIEGKIEAYAVHVADQWLTENEVAIESSLRNEIAAEFISKLRDLFVESNIQIPEEQTEIVDSMASKIEELEKELGEAIEKVASLSKEKEEATRQQAIQMATEGMTVVDAEKLKELAEGVEAESDEDFSKKLKILKENMKPAKKSTVSTLMEETSEDNKNLADKEEEIGDPRMRRYVDAMRRTAKA